MTWEQTPALTAVQREVKAHPQGDWISSIARYESHWTPSQRHAGSDARGVWQIVPVVRQDYNAANPDGQVSADQLYDPRVNWRVFEWYWNWLLQRPYVNGSPAWATLAYVWGPARVRDARKRYPIAMPVTIPGVPDAKRRYLLKVSAAAHGASKKRPTYDRERLLQWRQARYENGRWWPLSGGDIDEINRISKPWRHVVGPLVAKRGWEDDARRMVDAVIKDAKRVKRDAVDDAADAIQKGAQAAVDFGRDALELPSKLMGLVLLAGLGYVAVKLVSKN